jgi:hypothetical protein
MDRDNELDQFDRLGVWSRGDPEQIYCPGTVLEGDWFTRG